ncbi:MAG TPA: PDZ domain-containing protein [Thermoplasmata archaeon]|nr:PDZ domain-containing protein [Thermoplasmata archaeon]
MQIRYAATAAEPAEHWGRFSIDLDGVDAPSLDLVLPSWVPGSYHILNYVRGVRDVRARSVPSGTPLAVERVAGTRWRVPTAGHASVRVEYRVYGHGLVTEGFDLTPEHLFLNAALCLLYVDGHQDEPVELALGVPPDWQVVTELPETGPGSRRYRAASYDELVDNPVDAGRPLVLTVHPRGIPHRIAICGEGGNYEARRIEADLVKIVDATIELVGESPLHRYTFFYHLSDVPDGGLEHADSNSCVVSRTVFRPEESYRRFLDLTAHEYFHLYNVKRIRPKALLRFDYTGEQYTRLLWWMEGATDYFADLILRRAALLTPAQFLDATAAKMKQYLELPGHRKLSLEEASFTAWVDHYQPYEETPNESISYYVKGSLVSTCLDLEIRHRSENRASLETVLRTLWTEYGKVGRGIEEGELPAIARRSTGLDVEPFFERYVAGTEEIDLDAFARYAGLTFGARPKPKDDDSEPAGWLGILVEDRGGLARVRTSFAGGPGRAGGLTAGDEIVAINGVRVPFANLEKALRGLAPGSPIELAVFRRGYLRRLEVTAGTPPPEKYVFRPVADADARARAVYSGWVGAPWEPPAADGPG